MLTAGLPSTCREREGEWSQVGGGRREDYHKFKLDERPTQVTHGRERERGRVYIKPIPMYM